MKKIVLSSLLLSAAGLATVPVAQAAPPFRVGGICPEPDRAF